MNGSDINDKEYKIIAVADVIEDKPVPQSMELLAFAESFTQGDLSRTLIVLPGRSVSGSAESISGTCGIDCAAVEHDDLYYPNPELLADILSRLIDKFKPDMVLFTHTMRNCQAASKLSVMIKASSITGVESYRKESGGFIFRRSIFNGKLKADVQPGTDLKILTVLPGAYTQPEIKNLSGRNASVIRKKYTDQMGGYKPLSLSRDAEGSVKIEDADVIVSAGRGIGKEDNLGIIRETAAIFVNSAIGASRPVCDQRWLPFNHQVGVTGKTVAPKLYIACGISGSQQHIAGMKNSQCIVAINRDPDASIFSIADYCVIEDIITFLPVLVKKYKERYGK